MWSVALHSILLLFGLYRKIIQSLCGCAIPCSDHVRLNTVNAERIVVTSKGLYIICRVANFPRYGKHRKITEIEYKTENTENRGKQRFCNSKNKQTNKWKLLFLEHFIIVKFIFKNLRLVKLLWKFNKSLLENGKVATPYLYGQMA